MFDYINYQIKEALNIKQIIHKDESFSKLIESICEEAVNVYKSGKKILLAGNGGSAGDAQHMAAEIVNKFYFDREGLPAIALTTNTSILTAIGNDYGYENIFARQIQAYGIEGDMFIGISTSGNSPNIIKALEECKKKKIVTVGLTGSSGGNMLELCDYCIRVQSEETPRIQETHILIGHIICSVIEKAIFGKGF
ncbi:MAG: SIS domain-containing protein [Deltaproteobacteria bacterium]